MRATADGTPARTALAKYYPEENWDKIPATLKGYVETQVFTVHQIPLRGSAAKAEFVLRPASAADALAEIGIWRLYVLGQDTTLTRQLFQDAIREGSVDGVAEAGLGELSRMGGRTEDALVHFRSVAHMEHPSPRALTIAGMGMLMSEPTDRAPQQQLFAEAHATLVRSVALDSTDAAALGWYGRAAMAAGAVDGVVVSELRRATEANPGDESLASAYSIALAGTGHAAEAKAAAEGSRALKRDQAARHETMSAIDTLSALDSAVDEYNAGVDAARAGRAAEAREHFLAAERLAGDDEMRVDCRQAVASIDSILVDERARAIFGRAMRAGQAGNFAGAQAGFDSTKAMTTIEMLRAAAENGSHNAEAALEIHRGAAAAKKGAWSEAVAALQRAATLAREPQLKAHAEQLLAEAKKSANAAHGTPTRKP
jgi:tetratricopeptide (TPR) repeat protein